MVKLITSLWHEPRAPHAFGLDWRDWALVAAAVGLTVLEASVRDDLMYRVGALCLTSLMVLPLLWRRTHPLSMVLLAFGLNTIVQNYARMMDLQWVNLTTTVFLMVLPYSLFRWGSGREAFTGLVYIYLTYWLTIGLSDTPLGEMLAGILFLMIGAALGTIVRFRDAAHRRAKQQVHMREREQLARELHDTVAHYVSAIAIQAQAGRAAAATRAEAPLEALATIEAAASSTLTEMRRIVRALRTDDGPEFSAATSLDDIERLAHESVCPFDIEVSHSGNLRDLDASIASTLFRLTQEAITNAVRHANGAQKLLVHIAGQDEQIQLTIEDDGRPVKRSSDSGLGLQGMAERTALLGGELFAGPGATQGWLIKATLPRRGLAS